MATLIALGTDIVVYILREWVILEEWIVFDSALSNRSSRKVYLDLVTTFHHAFEGYFSALTLPLSVNVCLWMHARKLELGSIGTAQLSNDILKKWTSARYAEGLLMPELTKIKTIDIDNIANVMDCCGFVVQLTALCSFRISTCKDAAWICNSVFSERLTQIYLVQCEDLTDEIVGKLLESQPLIEELSIVMCNNITVDVLTSLRRPLLALEFHSLDEVPSSALIPYLQKGLRWFQCQDFSDEILLHLTETCAPTLTGLTLSDVSLGPVTALVKACTSLVEVDVSGIEIIDDSFVMALAGSNTELRWIDLRYLPLVTDLAIAVLLTQCKKLEELRVKDNSILGNCYSLIPKCCPLLRELELFSVSKQVLKSIMDSCPHLHSLSLADSWTEVLGSLYERGYQLKTLSLRLNLTNADLDSLFPHCPHLTDVNIADCVGINSECLTAIASSCRLKKLRCNFSARVPRPLLDDIIRTQSQTMRLLGLSYYYTPEADLAYLGAGLPRAKCYR